MVDHSLQKIEDQCPRSLKDSGEVYRAVIAEGLGWGVTGTYVCMYVCMYVGRLAYIIGHL